MLTMPEIILLEDFMTLTRAGWEKYDDDDDDDDVKNLSPCPTVTVLFKSLMLKNGFQVKLKGARVLPRLLFDRLVIINRINVVGRLYIIIVKN